MLRITRLHADGRLVLKLEGRLSGPWVDELETCWRALGAATPIAVDLGDVLLVDAAGEGLLAMMHHAGAQFLTRGCAMRELVREIAGRS